jgi:hypothetical protein
MQAAAGDTTKEQACKDAFSTCADQAKAARQALEDAIKGCFKADHACDAQDGGKTERAACRQQLHTCVQANLPPAPPLPPCIQALQMCVEGGGQPKDCAQQAHACILANMPQGAGDGGLGWGPKGGDHDGDRGGLSGDAGPKGDHDMDGPKGGAGAGGGRPPFGGGTGGGKPPFPFPQGTGGSLPPFPPHGGTGGASAPH